MRSGRLTLRALWSVSLLTIFVGLLLPGGCPPIDVPGDPNEPTTPSGNARDCVGCHTDEALLKAVARTEEPLPEESGEG